jgi:minor extracellular protease Epr
MNIKKLSSALSVFINFCLIKLPGSIFAETSSDIRRITFRIITSESTDRENYKLTTSETVNGAEKQKYIILFKNAVDEEALANANADISYIYTCIPAASILIPEEGISELRNNPDVVSIEPDTIVEVKTQKIDWGITKTNAQSAWNSGYTGQGVKIAIIDTGIDKDHPDLNVAGGTSCVSYTTDYDDDEGHGTHVAA